MDTKTRIVMEARREFYDRGFKRADIVAIARRAGVTKGGLYYNFKSKSHLAIGVLKLIERENSSCQHAETDLKGINSADGIIERLLRFDPQSEPDWLNILTQFSIEIPRRERAIHRMIQVIVRSYLEYTSEMIRQLQIQESAQLSADSEELALLVCTTKLGIVTLSGLLQNEPLAERLQSILRPIMQQAVGRRS